MQPSTAGATTMTARAHVRARNRIELGLALALLIAFGLGTRRYAELLPSWLALYGGDVAWGTMFYVAFCGLAPTLSTRNAWLLALGTTELIELSQLYQAPWLNAIRDTRIGGLLLGHAFVWSDVACLLLGTTLGALLDRARRSAVR